MRRKNTASALGGIIRLVFVYGLVFAMFLTIVLGEQDGGDAGGEEHKEAEEEVEPATAVLFPWFVVAVGVMVFFLLSRFIHMLPYTAVMFILGTCMGLGVALLDNEDELSESITLWLEIDSEVLLLVFLPGLIFKDAFGLNVHLFRLSFFQLLNFAFPMVLAGTSLTALVAFYVFPYGWSWNLSMTMGAILSATDPVAVSSLLAEVGAPPRLKMHISGESLLNDGSALVFFQIFAGLFLLELNVVGVGEDLTVGEGFAKFFKASLGGIGIGIAFGIALIFLLLCLNRRLNVEENVVQVSATITIAYLTYFVADVVAGTSGVIAVVFCGIFAKAFGKPMINDQEMMDSFWILVEHILNTVLFALGGVVWGEIIANPSYREGEFKAKDWGYLFLLYVLLTLIRFFLMYANYPLTRYLGLSTNLRETFFMSYGGLRGAVGISLAIALDNEVLRNTNDPELQSFTNTLFGMVGGIAFLTLVVNGTLSGPMLIKLGLASATEIRSKIVERYSHTLDEHALHDFVQLLTDMRFRNVDYAVVSHHIPVFHTLTIDEFKTAVEKYKKGVPPNKYKEPYVKNVLSYLEKHTSTVDDPDSAVDEEEEEPWACVVDAFDRRKEETDPAEGAEGVETEGMGGAEVEEGAEGVEAEGVEGAKAEEGAEEVEAEGVEGAEAEEGTEAVEPLAQTERASTASAVELRKLFVELVRSDYHKQIKLGELDARQGFVAYVLLESLEFAQDAANKGKRLNDWEMAEKLNRTWYGRGDQNFRKRLNIFCGYKGDRAGLDTKFQQLRIDVAMALAFMEAHWQAQERFRTDFIHSEEFSAEERMIIDESNAQVLLAVKVLQSNDRKVVENAVSHLLCVILLNKSAMYIETVTASGFLKEKEAADYLEEIEVSLEILHTCSAENH